MNRSLKVDNEFRDLIPPLRLDERAELEASIQQDGCRDPLTVWSGTVIDGHNRYEICTRLSVPFEVVEKEFDSKVDALIWIRRNQLARRNLTDDQRAINAERLRQLESQRVKAQRSAKAAEQREVNAGRKEVLSDNATDKIPAVKRDTRKEMAENTKLPERKLRGAALVIKERPDLADKVEQGEIKMADAVREIKRAEVVASLESVEAREQKALEGVYDVIVIDPPWPMQKIDRDERQNQVAFDYPTMSEAEMADMQMPAADDCHMWLWTTHKFLPMALRLCEGWGFRYVCTFVWHKPGGFQPIGLPQYNCEFALYCRKGSPKFLDTKAFPTCFEAPRGGHSEKPEEFYDVVRRVTGGRRIDIFNRRTIEGFDVWGKEAADE
jgi:N6-adenosine-specific RNA methylase IME4